MIVSPVILSDGPHLELPTSARWIVIPSTPRTLPQISWLNWNQRLF